MTAVHEYAGMSGPDLKAHCSCGWEEWVDDEDEAEDAWENHRDVMSMDGAS